MPHQSARHAFVLIEGLVIILVAGLVLAVLALGAEHSRRLARLGEDMARLRQLGAATGQYGADFADRFWSFSWRAGVAPIDPGDPNGSGLFTATTDLQAAANQMVYILRTRGNRPQMPVISTFIPQVQYGQLVLAEHMNRALPTRVAISSADRDRMLWANDPLGYDRGLYSPNLGFSVGPSIDWRHPYGASLRVPAAFWDGSAVGERVSSGGTTNTYLIPGNAQLFGQQLTGVAYPSQKAIVADYIARHYGPRLPWCTSSEARLPVLMSDGSADVKSAAASNPGCNPNTGQSFSMSYAPSAIDPPAMQPRFLWTRGRIGGRDFGGPEVSGF
jgi:hypothetical protein